MTTPAKFLKKPDTDLSELGADDLTKLASGLIKRTIKLVLADSEEQSDAWNEPVLAFLRAASHLGIPHPHLAGAMLGVFQKDGPPRVLDTLLALAEENRKEETVGAFLTLIRGELLQGDGERARAFKEKVEKLETVLQA